MYLEHGLEVARGLVHRLFDELLLSAPLLGAGLDWKTSLQELTAAAGLGVPEYRIAEDGPGPPQDVHRHRGGRRAASSAPARGGPRRKPSRRRPSWPWRALTAEAGAPASVLSEAAVPELPEVEVVRRGLAEHVLGRTIAAVEVAHPRAVRRHPPAAPTSRPGWPAAPSPGSAGAASTCGWSSTRPPRATTRCSPTSG